MDCTDCGACCIGTRVELRLHDPLLVHPDHYESVAGHTYLKRIDGHCILFDMETRRCKDYANRPSVCRNFELGSGTCRFFRARAGIKDFEAGAV